MAPPARPWKPSDAQASFLCRHEQSLDYGTHSIVIGLVEKVLIHGTVDPLVYVDGTYSRVCLPPRESAIGSSSCDAR